MYHKPGFVVALIIVGIAIASIMGVMYNHVSNAALGPEHYTAYCMIAWAVHLAMFFSPVPACDDPRVGSYLHLHHWYWPLPCAHVPVAIQRIDDRTAMFIGAFIHGVACFGAEVIFYSTQHHARHPSWYDWQRMRTGSESESEQLLFWARAVRYVSL